EHLQVKNVRPPSVWAIYYVVRDQTWGLDFLCQNGCGEEKNPGQGQSLHGLEVYILAARGTAILLCPAGNCHEPHRADSDLFSTSRANTLEIKLPRRVRHQQLVVSFRHVG